MNRETDKWGRREDHSCTEFPPKNVEVVELEKPHFATIMEKIILRVEGKKIKK